MCDVVLHVLQIPELRCFDEKINFFESLRTEIAEMRTPVDIYWLRVNAQPLKVQLSQLAAVWATHYTDFLHKCCINRIDAVTAFINRMHAFLSTKPPTEDDEEPADKETLYNFMTHIRDVKIAIEPIKGLFAPLRDLVGTKKN